MKRLCLVLAGLVAFSVLTMGCEQTAHKRYRDMTYRRIIDTDILGFADDVDAVFLSERPTHLSTWYNR